MAEGRGTLMASYVDQEEAGSAQIASGAQATSAPATAQMSPAESDDDGESSRPHLGSLDIICL
jgi:hypothetical protein